MPINILDAEEVEKRIEDLNALQKYKKDLPKVICFDSKAAEILSMEDPSDYFSRQKMIIKDLRKKKMNRRIEDIIHAEKENLKKKLEKVPKTLPVKKNEIIDPMWFINADLDINLNTKGKSCN
jgi:hypothetical protein